MTVDAILGTRNRTKILRILFRRDGLSGRQVASEAGISPSASKSAMEELVRAGVVFREREPGKWCYELNRSHYLYHRLQQLYAEEERLPRRVAETVRRHLRGLRPPCQLLCLGVSAAGHVTLAVLPRIEAAGGALKVLERQLRSEFGLQLKGLLADPRDIRSEDRVWTLPEGTASSEEGGRGVDQERALRFFDIASGADS